MPAAKSPQDRVAVADSTPAPAVARPAMNEMTGRLASMDADDHTFRMSLDGDIHPQLDYNKDTVVLFGGRRISLADLNEGDPIVARYVGKDLMAREIEKLGASAFSKVSQLTP
ncbi:MAG TPA: hypothetical protein VMU17_01555 [Elusimicrobiota bacterium]|nr:hypothetical protein [Elusimicrobiota bacterium]